MSNHAFSGRENIKEARGFILESRASSTDNIHHRGGAIDRRGKRKDIQLIGDHGEA